MSVSNDTKKDKPQDTESELGDIEAREPAGDTDPDESEDSEKESKLDLEKEDEKKKKSEEGQADKLSKAEIEALKMEESWAAKIISGEKELSDCDAWLIPRVKARLDNLQQPKLDPEKIKQELKEEILEDAQFDKLKDSLPELSKTQVAELKRFYTEYREMGKYKALSTAVKIMGLDIEARNADSHKKARGDMTLPPGGQPAGRRERLTIKEIYKGNNQAEYEKWKKNKFKVDSQSNPLF